MKTLYIDNKNAHLMSESRRILIRNKSGSLIQRIPINNIKRIVFAADIMLTTRFIGKMYAEHIDLIVVNYRYPQQSTIINAGSLMNTKRKLKQYELSGNNLKCNSYARLLLIKKIIQQINFAKKQKKMFPKFRYRFTKNQKIMLNVLDKVMNENISIDSLRGLEGLCTKHHFLLLSKLLPKKTKFKKRNRRPPKDPVNAILSLTYTLLHWEAYNALVAYGLDPYLGFYHKPAYSRASLACDLMELVRIDAESFVLDLFRTKVLRPNYFIVSKNGACFLSKKYRSCYYKAYESWVGSIRKTLSTKSRLWSKAVGE